MSSAAQGRLKWWQRYDWRFAGPIVAFACYVAAVLYLAVVR